MPPLGEDSQSWELFPSRFHGSLVESWVTPTGEYIIANLGTSIDEFELHRAIITRAPEGKKLRLGAQRAYGDD
jgi:hypothetical protein